MILFIGMLCLFTLCTIEKLMWSRAFLNCCIPKKLYMEGALKKGQALLTPGASLLKKHSLLSPRFFFLLLSSALTVARFASLARANAGWVSDGKAVLS